MGPRALQPTNIGWECRGHAGVTFGTFTIISNLSKMSFWVASHVAHMILQLHWDIHNGAKGTPTDWYGPRWLRACRSHFGNKHMTLNIWKISYWCYMVIWLCWAITNHTETTPMRPFEAYNMPWECRSPWKIIHTLRTLSITYENLSSIWSTGLIRIKSVACALLV